MKNQHAVERNSSHAPCKQPCVQAIKCFGLKTRLLIEDLLLILKICRSFNSFFHQERWQLFLPNISSPHTLYRCNYLQLLINSLGYHFSKTRHISLSQWQGHEHNAQQGSSCPIRDSEHEIVAPPKTRGLAPDKIDVGETKIWLAVQLRATQQNEQRSRSCCG